MNSFSHHANLFRMSSLILMSLYVPGQTASADIITWDGGGFDGLWTTPQNWDTDTGPVAGDTVNISTGDTVISPINNLPANLRINLTGNSTLTRPDNVIRLNNATLYVASGSALTGNGFWDLSQGDLTFDDGAIVTILNWEQKGVNTFTFNLGPTGFTPLTPGIFRNDGNNPASPATLIADDTYTVDMANYTGGTGVISLVDFGSDAEGMDDAAFQNATLNVINPGSYISTLRWNDTDEAIELNITAVPEASTWSLFFIGLTGILCRKRRA